MAPLCSSEDRILTPLYLRLWTECPCCLFYRGVVLGAVVGIALGAVVSVLR